MKSLIIAAFTAFISLTTHLSAVTSHELSITGSDIKLIVEEPEGFLGEENKTLDLVFQDSQDSGRRLGFHYFLDPEFKLAEFTEVMSYINWILEELSISSKRSQTSIHTSKDYATYSLMSTDSAGVSLYHHIYVGRVGDELVFAAASTSDKGFEEAAKDSDFFLEKIFWRRGE